jgi:hypothetical protein
MPDKLPQGLRVLTGCQARAARSVLCLTVRKLAEKSDISESSIRRIEQGGRREVTTDLLIRLQTWFESQGFVFLWNGRPGLTWPVNRYSRSR